MELQDIHKSLVGVNVQLDDAIDMLKTLLSRLPNPPSKSSIAPLSPTVSASSLGEKEISKSWAFSSDYEFDVKVTTEIVDEFNQTLGKFSDELWRFTQERDVSDAHKVFDEMSMLNPVHDVKVCSVPFELQLIVPLIDGIGVGIWPTGVGTFFDVNHEVLFTGRGCIFDTFYDIGGIWSVDIIGVPSNQLCSSVQIFYELKFVDSVVHLCVLCSNEFLILNGGTKLLVDSRMDTEQIMTSRKEGYGWSIISNAYYDIMGSVEAVLGLGTYGVSIIVTNGIGTTNNYGNWRHMNLECNKIEQDTTRFTPSNTKFQRGISSVYRRFCTYEITSTLATEESCSCAP